MRFMILHNVMEYPKNRQEDPMKKYQSDTATRFFLFVSGSIIWLGIWLTGFSTAHWVLYLPAVLFYFAAATGICPGLIVAKKLFPSHDDDAVK